MGGPPIAPRPTLRPCLKPTAPNEKGTTIRNILTGKSCSQEVNDYLLSFPQVGHDLHQKFIQECAEDGSRFEKPLKRHNVKTFVTACARNKRTNNHKIANLKSTNNLVGRLLYLSQTTPGGMSLEHILSYPLTPVPLSMCHADGTMAHTDKSALLNMIKSFTTTEHSISPPPSDVAIVDGNYFLQRLCHASSLPKTYGGLAKDILWNLTTLRSKIVHLVFDSYKEPSIKDAERCRRGEETITYSITGPAQQRPSDMTQALKSRSFKVALPLFLMDEWKKEEYQDLMSLITLFVSHKDHCVKFRSNFSEIVPELLPKGHDEADTRYDNE